mgnify:FL=1
MTIFPFFVRDREFAFTGTPTTFTWFGREMHLAGRTCADTTGVMIFVAQVAVSLPPRPLGPPMPRRTC